MAEHETPGRFKDQIRAALLDGTLQRVVEHATDITLEKRQSLKAEMTNWEELRDQARELKMYCLDWLPQLLEQFESALRDRGGKVHWAVDGSAARDIILDLARRRKVRLVVKGKSIMSEEIELRPALEAAGIEALETDLGEFIVQLQGKMPSHITAPALHLSRQQIGRLFEEKLGIPYSEDPVELTAAARKHLRSKFLDADMGIIGANFLVAETGTIVSVENEGNIRLSSNLPPLVICVAGIEKVIPALPDLYPLLKLLGPHGTGQRATAAVSMLTGVRGKSEPHGPEELHVVLIDNGRSRIAVDHEMREALTCIRCGSCLNICPVFRRVSGHAYGSVNPGPIGAVLTPLLVGFAEAGDLPFGSSLCGACAEVCPVRIPIPELLLRLRGRIARERGGLGERLAMRGAAAAWRRPYLYRRGAKSAARLWPLVGGLLGKTLLKAWCKERRLPPPAGMSFNAAWRQEEH
ncbi:lactate utilization protein [bacterium]|nr:lactate utilization protein [candidate division CSSED10-310 bacterium]